MSRLRRTVEVAPPAWLAMAPTPEGEVLGREQVSVGTLLCPECHGTREVRRVAGKDEEACPCPLCGGRGHVWAEVTVTWRRDRRAL